MQDIHETADRLARRRARVFPVLAILFITQQTAYFASEGGSAVDRVKLGAWLVMSVVLLLGLATGGGWLRSSQVRALLNDETTRAHRQSGIVNGFYAAMATCIVVYLVTPWHPVSAIRAVHVIFSVGVGAALIRFGALERRALG